MTTTDVTPRLLHDPPLATIDDYIATGGGTGLERARAIGPDATIAAIGEAGLRGRGGAGFPAAIKWRSVAHGGGERHYAVANGAEGEPGTFKDRALLRANPYAVIEGLLIAAETVGAEEAYLAVKASFTQEIERLRAALVEVEAAGWLGSVTLLLVTGPDEYLFGEEKALLEVIEGNEPLPRWLPPYLHGLFASEPQLGWQAAEVAVDLDGSDQPFGDEAAEANPTLVNNVESLSQAAWILAHGAEAFRQAGTAESAGTILCTVVGDVVAPGVVEVPMGTTLRAVIEACGGAHEGRTVKAVFPGVANAVVTGDQLDTPLTYEAMAAIGSGLGAGGFIVYDDSACMVEVVSVLSRFLYVESCGQCPPCKLGTGAITAALERIRTGAGSGADLDLVELRLRNVTDGNRCYLPVQEQTVVSSVLRSFPDDVAAHLEGYCPSQRSHVPPPKILDIEAGTVTWDLRQELKRPDWTYP